jgi:hypothetical protein
MMPMPNMMMPNGMPQMMGVMPHMMMPNMMPQMPAMMGMMPNMMMPNMMPQMQAMGMMPGMMMNGAMPMGMMMAQPAIMTRMACEMTKDGMVCKISAMDTASHELLQQRCEWMIRMMAMGAPTMMFCGGMPMIVSMGTTSNSSAKA